jgi:hypothetical protein
MPVPHFEVPTGDIDGINTVFYVSVPYLPGSTAVFRNGLLQERSLEDGWYETDPGSGEIALKEAPRGTPTGYPDVLQVFFIDTSPVLPETVVQQLHGRLRASEELSARMVGVGQLRGSVEAAGTLAGHLVGVFPISCRIEEVGRLRGCLVLRCGEC